MESFFVFAIALLAVSVLLGISPERATWESRLRSPRQFKLWHLLAAVALMAILLAILNSASSGFALAIVLAAVAGLFLRAWRDEFVFVMGLRDDEFPGRNDRLIWILLLLFLAPIGIWFFRGYRLAHWPEPEPAAVAPVTGGVFPQEA